MDRFTNNLIDLELEFRDTLRTMCEIFADHTLPSLPDWLEEALNELTIRG